VWQGVEFPISPLTCVVALIYNTLALYIPCECVIANLYFTTKIAAAYNWKENAVGGDTNSRRRTTSSGRINISNGKGSSS